MLLETNSRQHNQQNQPDKGPRGLCIVPEASLLMFPQDCSWSCTLTLYPHNVSFSSSSPSPVQQPVCSPADVRLLH